RWFPADVTFLVVTNMDVYPELGQLQLLLSSEIEGEHFRRFASLIGHIDRLAYAYSEDRQHPERSRTIVRMTGAIKRKRLIDFFRKEWKAGFAIEEVESKGESVTVIYDTASGDGALAFVGEGETADLLY